MKQRLKNLFVFAAVLGAVQLGVPSARGFSLVGPYDTWQVANLNYNPGAALFPIRSPRGADLGGPQNLGEEYRRNVGALFYAFDYAFLDYYGALGMREVDKAVKILNDLPAFSSMSADLSEFPLDTMRINYRAAALGLIDMKSIALGILVEELGLLSPHQYAWTLRARANIGDLPCPFFSYWIVRRNFDPVTWEPTSYINGALYTFAIEWSCPAAPDIQDAGEIPVDPLAFNWSAVAENDGYIPGGFYSGLTRDDVGGLRYIYRKNNYNYEPVPSNVFGGASGAGSPWSPVDPTITNTPITGLSFTMGGVDKLKFNKVYFDGLLGQTFTAVSNSYTMPVVVNVQSGTSLEGDAQINLDVRDLRLTRVAVVPDIIFSADDLDAVVVGTYARTIPVYVRSADYAVNNGPGIMESGGTGTSIVFSKTGPFLNDSMLPTRPFVNESTSFQGFRYAVFDGSTNPPVIFPSGASIKDMERIYFGDN